MKFLALIGDPVAHSKSPRMHNNAIKCLNLSGIYTRYHLKNPNILKAMFLKLRLDGANITLPFKEQALEIADVKDEFAKNIGSANTLLLKDSKIYAYNTDATGFLKAIEEFKDIKKAFLLGAGGTARAIAYALKSKNIDVYILNRSEKRFANFKGYHCELYENLTHFDCDLIVNTSSAGLNDETLPCDKRILEKILAKSSYAFDVIYGKKTSFLKLCKEHGIPCKDGTNMLLWQGVFAFELFFGVKDREEIKKAMEEALNLS